MNVASRWRKFSPTPVEFVLLSVIWGASFVAIEVGVAQVPPLLFAAVRFDLAGAVMLAVAAVAGERLVPRGRHEWTAVGLAGGLLVGGHHALLYLGAERVPGAVAAIVVSLVPVLTVLFATATLREERLEGLQHVGVVVGFLGVVVVAGADASGGVGAPAGVGLVFLSAVVFALGSVALRPFQTALSSASFAGWMMVLGAVPLHAASALRGDSLGVWTPSAVGAVLYLSLGASVVAYLVYFRLFDRVGPSELNLVSYLQPVATTAISWALLGYVLEPATVGGLLVIFLGFALVKHRALWRLAVPRRARARSW